MLTFIIFFLTETLVVWQSAPPALLLATPLIECIHRENQSKYRQVEELLYRDKIICHFVIVSLFFFFFEASVGQAGRCSIGLYRLYGVIFLLILLVWFCNISPPLAARALFSLDILNIMWIFISLWVFLVTHVSGKYSMFPPLRHPGRGFRILI